LECNKEVLPEKNAELFGAIRQLRINHACGNKERLAVQVHFGSLMRVDDILECQAMELKGFSQSLDRGDIAEPVDVDPDHRKSFPEFP
jgi:hypothetical protein